MAFDKNSKFYPKHYSYTRFDNYDTCPRMYYKKYKDPDRKKFPEKPSEPAMIGKFLHAAIAEYDRHLLKNQLLTDVTVVPEIARKLFFGTNTGLDPSFFGEVSEILDRFAGVHIFNPYTTVGIEEMEPLELAPDTCFWVVFDRLEIEGEEATIIDYKSDHKIRSRSDVEKDLQLHLYAWAVSKLYPQVTRFNIALEFIRHGKRMDPLTIDLQGVEHTEEKIFSRIKMMEADLKCDPKPGAGCAWCNFTETCPALKNISPDRIVVSNKAEALRVATELTLLENQVSQRKEALKAWCVPNGAVELNGLQWGHFARDKKEYPLVKFREVCQQFSVNPDNYLKVDGMGVKKLFKNKEMAAEMDKIIINNPYSVFDSQKLKGDD
jgi:hypothetical protein